MRSVLFKNPIWDHWPKLKLEHVPAIQIHPRSIIAWNLSIILHMSSTYWSPINHANNLRPNESPQAIPCMHLQNYVLIKTSVFDINSMMCKKICSIQQTSGAPTSNVGPGTPDPRSSQTTLQHIKSNITFSFVVKLMRNAHAVGAPGPFRAKPTYGFSGWSPCNP